MNKKLFYIKLAHTIIWFFYVFVIFYILYAGMFNKVNLILWITIGLVILEGIVLLIFKWRCPLTVWGSKYTEDTEPGFDIFIPKWLAVNNKLIFGSMFFMGLMIVAARVIL